jgi:hypothetical protein
VSKITIISKTLSFADVGITSNPSRRPINWERTISSIPVFNDSTKLYEVEPLGTLSIIDGQRPTNIDGTTTFSIAISPLANDRYRVTHTIGTAPAFKTTRSLACSGIVLTLVLNPNLSLTLIAGSGTPFSTTVAGDTIFIPGVSTGDSVSPFNSLNEGYWVVLSSTLTQLSLARFADSGVFSGTSETVTPSDNSQIQAFSSSGVQVGDTVEISAGFSFTAQHAYEILAVNPEWIEFESSAPLGPQVGIIPGVAGMVFYKLAIRYLRIEGDQEFIIRLNSDTGNTNRIEPIIPGDIDHAGWMEKWGPVWKLDVVNRTMSTLNLVVLQAE